MIGNDQMLKYRASRQLSRYESCSKVRNMHNNKDTHSMKGMREKKSAKVDANHKAILIIIKKKYMQNYIDFILTMKFSGIVMASNQQDLALVYIKTNETVRKEIRSNKVIPKIIT